MPETSVAKPHPRRMLAAWYLRSLDRSFISVFMTFGLVLLFALLLLRGGADDVESNLRKTRADVLALQPETVDDANNAMLDYQGANAAIVRFSGQWTDSPEYFASRSAEGYFAGQEVKTYLQQNAAAIQRLLQAADKPRCDWRLNYAAGYAMMLPHLSMLRSDARLLSVYARECAHQRDHTEAAHAIAAMHAIARHAERDPLLICGLVSIAIDGIADQTIESIVLWETPTSAADIESYRKSAGLYRKWHERALRTLECEKRFALYTLDGMVNESQLNGSASATAALGVPYYVGGAIFWYGADRRCCLKVMNDIIEETRAGKRTHDDTINARIEANQTGPAIFTTLLLPSLGRSSDAFARNQEQAIATDAALAWLLFRAKYNREPKSLEELAPEFLAAVPHGVFHDLPLRVRTDTSGFREKPPPLKTGTAPLSAAPLLPGIVRIYTVGKNGQDDQGLCANAGEELKPKPNANSEIEEDDTGFRVPPFKEREATR